MNMANRGNTSMEHVIPDGRRWLISFRYDMGSAGSYWDPPDPGEIEWEHEVDELVPGMSPPTVDFNEWCAMYGYNDDKKLLELEDEALRAALDSIAARMGDCDD